MKNQYILIPAIFLSISVSAQQSRFYSDPEEKFKEAKEYYQKEQYSLAYPILKELQPYFRPGDQLLHDRLRTKAKRRSCGRNGNDLH